MPRAATGQTAGVSLRDLILERMGDRSYGDLARESGISRQTWAQWGGGKKRLMEFPKIAQIRAIARTLRVTESAVIRAAGVSLGLDVRDPGAFADRLPSGVEHLGARQREAILAVIWAMVELAEDRPAVPGREAADIPSLHLIAADERREPEMEARRQRDAPSEAELPQIAPESDDPA